MKNKLNKVAIKKWVDALRSGKYRQCNGHLKVQGNKRPLYCCLGVACLVAKSNNVDIDLERAFNKHNVLPDVVKKWFGFKFRDPKFLIDDKNKKIIKKMHNRYGKPNIERAFDATTLNDHVELNFKEIADCIEYTCLRSDKK